MVVLAASVVTKSGKPLLSRQFRPLPRSRIDSLLSSFPKLIPPGSQHTTVETPDVRFVYQVFEEFYVLLVVNKGSNILQDIQTLSLLVRLISTLTPQLSEPAILASSFELLCAFDEVVSMGFKENVTLQQVRNVLEGESHEEKIQEIIARNKEAEAKEELKRRAKQLEMQRREQQRTAAQSATLNRLPGGYGGAPSGGQNGGGAGAYASVPRFESAPVERDPYRSSSPAPSSLKPAFKGTGMKLGKKGKQTDLLEALGGEAYVPPEENVAVAASSPVMSQGETTPTSARTQAAAGRSEMAQSVLPKVDPESVHITIREHLSLSLLRDGGIKSLELKGDLDLKITDSSLSKLKLILSPVSEKASDLGKDLQFQQHPNVAKFAGGAGADRVVALKNADRSFPVGQGLMVLKWRLSTKDESIVPLTVNCWPTPNDDGTCSVNIEYELEAQHMTLRNVVISIPLPHGAYPTVNDHTGEWSISPSGDALLWTIDTINSEESSGTMEFQSKAEDPSLYFPINVDFVSAESLVEVKVEKATLLGSGDDATFSQETILNVDRFEIV